MPGKNLDLSAIIRAKKFKSRGNKPAALQAFKTLQEAGIGTLEELGSARGTAMVGYKCTLTVNHYNITHCNITTQKYQFLKKPVPTTVEEKTSFAKKLSRFGVTLRSYATSMVWSHTTSFLSKLPGCKTWLADQ